MASAQNVVKALEQQLNQNIKLLAHSKAQETTGAQQLESVAVREDKIERQLSQYMLYAKKRCVDGFFSCLNVVKELARTDLQIDLGALEQNIHDAFNRFDSVATVNGFSQKAQEGTAWKELLGITDTSLQLLYRGAKQLVDAGHHPEAEAAFFFLTTVDFKQYSFWLGLGHAAFHLGNLNQAINAYEMAENCQQNSVWPHIYSANCFEALNDHEEALNALEIASRNYEIAQEKDPQLEGALRERIAKAKLKLP